MGDFVFGLGRVSVCVHVFSNMSVHLCVYVFAENTVSVSENSIFQEGFEFLQTPLYLNNSIYVSLSVHLSVLESRCRATGVLCWEEFALGLRWRRREIGPVDKTWKS